MFKEQFQLSQFFNSFLPKVYLEPSQTSAVEHFAKKKFILDLDTVVITESLFVITSQVDGRINCKLRDFQMQIYHESTRYRVFLWTKLQVPKFVDLLRKTLFLISEGNDFFSVFVILDISYCRYLIHCIQTLPSLFSNFQFHPHFKMCIFRKKVEKK